MTEDKPSDQMLADQGELPTADEIIWAETEYTRSEQSLIDRLRGEHPPERGKQYPDPDEAPPEHEFHREYDTEPRRR